MHPQITIGVNIRRVKPILQINYRLQSLLKARKRFTLTRIHHFSQNQNLFLMFSQRFVALKEVFLEIFEEK